MKSVMQSQGLAGVFDNAIVESNGDTKKAPDNANSIAREALRNLSQIINSPSSWDGEDRY
jgi:hypothetical protein